MSHSSKRRALFQCFSTLVIGASGFGIYPAAFACEKEDSAAVIENFANQLFDLFGRLNGKDESYASRRAALRKIVERRFAYKDMASIAGSIAVTEMRANELSRFHAISRDLIVEVLLGFFALYSTKVRFSVLGFRQSRSGNRSILETLLVTGSDVEINIRWDLIDVDGKCMVLDVRVLGISLINDVAQDVHNAYERDGVDEVFKVLNRKIANSRREYPD